ncbi:unnamed protein product [Clonostachys byssicola]|uniref:Fungal N-terminal domain-containing protein n=1 Tax=Clonostachys byssicola TaxID=160290 RepID=A0A9N9Y1W6_9HYPO|nr:unnamed protein product [Clonostachys byssicola]
MEGIGVAANLVAVVDITAKIAAQCYDYAKKVYSAKADIDRVQKEIIALTGIAKSVQGLLSGPNGDRLATSHPLQTAIGDALDLLRTVDEKMALKKGQKTMSRLGLRALKWPFKKSEIKVIIGDLRNCGQNINSALQMLGASFFFKTGEAERSTLSRFFSTIAADMVIKIPEFGTAVKEALDKDADFRRRAPGQ